MKKSKNKIPFKHARSLEILRDERRGVVTKLKEIKNHINHMQQLRVGEPDDFVYFMHEALYGGSVPVLTKRQSQWKKDLKSIEESIKLLKDDGQKHHDTVFETVQAAERFKKEGSYNCSYGC